MTKPDAYSPLPMLAKQSLEDLSRLSKMNVSIARAIREADPGSSDPTQLIVRKLKAIHVGTTSVDALKLPTSYDELKEWLADFEVNVRDKDSRLRRFIDPLGLLDALARPSETTTRFDASRDQRIVFQRRGNQAVGTFTVENHGSGPARYGFDLHTPSDIGPNRLTVNFEPMKTGEIPADESVQISLTIEFTDPEYMRALPNRSVEFRIDVRQSIDGEPDSIPSTVWVQVQLETRRDGERPRVIQNI